MKCLCYGGNMKTFACLMIPDSLTGRRLQAVMVLWKYLLILL